jgi:hypothetical protein
MYRRITEKKVYPDWNESEMEVLRNQYGKTTCQQLSIQLGRTPDAIMRKARLLGLKSRYKGSEAYSSILNPYSKRKPITEHPIWRKEGEVYLCRGRFYIKKKGKRMVYARYLMEQAGHDLTGKMVVHLDCNVNNLELSNLKVITRKENQSINRKKFKDPEMHKYRVRMGLTGESWVDLVLKCVVQ